MINFLNKYVIRIYSIMLIMLAICEICFVVIHKENNIIMCINIALNFIFAIIGFTFSLNPFYNFSFDHDDFWKFETADAEGYYALRLKLLKSIMLIVINSIGLTLTMARHHSHEFIPLFVTEIIINFAAPTLLILKLTQMYLFALFFPKNLPIDNLSENSNSVPDHFSLYYLRYIALWTYILCAYEIFATYKINQNDVCISRGSISIVILNLVVNFIVGSVLIFEPLNLPFNEKTNSPMVFKIAMTTLPTILIYVATGCPNSYLTSVFILETGLHMILPVGVFIFIAILSLLIGFITFLFQTIMSVNDLANIPENNTAEITQTPSSINQIQQIQPNEPNGPNEPNELIEPFLHADKSAKSVKKNNFVIVNKYDNNCCICLNEIDKTKQYALLNCSHNFHEDCIKQLEDKEDKCDGIKCPLCLAITNNNMV